jgi:lipopolysaccharide export system permease protein
MKLIDRLLLRNFFQAWLICFISLVSLYVVIDLFNKLDEFFEASDGTVGGFFATMAGYYGFQFILIFDRLYGVIVLLAAMFTIAWMQRNNELLPLLSAGVPTRRVLRPIFVGSLVMLALGIGNREVLMPQFAEQLQNPASDPRGEKILQVRGTYEPNDILVSGQSARRQDSVISGFTITVPEKIAGGLLNITAREARYLPPCPEWPTGGWLMSETTPPKINTQWREAVLVELDPAKFFFRTERVDFAMLTRSQTWYQYASLWEIFQELQKGDSARLGALAVQLHLRLTLPILTLIMVWMGVSMILRDQGRNVFLNAGLCLVMSAMFYAACYLARHLGEQEYLSPPMAAWLPVLLFGPLALALFDAIHT